MLVLALCEKPSQAKTLAEALSGSYESKDGYFVGQDERVYTYAFGHLVTCQMPDEINSDWGWKGDVNQLPFFIKDIPLKLKDDSGVKKQYKVIVDLMKEAETICISTDAGREGEHIFRKIYDLSGLNKPLKRIWMQDMTEDGIKKAYANRKDASEYDGLAIAGRLREETDLLVGLNGTQLLTRLSGSSKVISLGRVQTPTLAMIVHRDTAIEGFKKHKHYTIAAKIDKDTMFELVVEEGVQLSKEKAEEMLLSLGNRTGYDVSSSSSNEKSPKLFDLTELQKFMNDKHSWSADKTLKVTQSLYEKQLVTYPRTSSRYLATDTELQNVLANHSAHPWIQEIVENDYSFEKTFINPSKVTDHEAIIITNKQSSSIQGDEKVLYDVIFTRFVTAFYPNAVKEKLVAAFKDGEYTFEAKETIITDLGWRKLVGDTVQEGKIKTIDMNDIPSYELLEKETQPQKRYSESSLLGDMKNAGKFIEDKEEKSLLKEVEGIGTPATRASIIELLLTRGFMERKGKQLISTSLGREIIHMMPTGFSLYSAKMTAYFETMLLEVEKNNLTDEDFYEKSEVFIQEIASEIRENVTQMSQETTKEVIVSCPTCGKHMYETERSYSCSGYKEGCKTSLWKNGLEKLGKKTITKSEAKKLLEGKEIKVKLKSKTEVEFVAQGNDDTPKEEIASCHKCGKPMYETERAYSCSGYSEGCKTALWKNGLEKLGKKTITKAEAKVLLADKEIKVKLKSKAGKAYEKNVRFNKEKGWIELVN